LNTVLFNVFVIATATVVRVSVGLWGRFGWLQTASTQTSMSSQQQQQQHGRYPGGSSRDSSFRPNSSNRGERQQPPPRQHGNNEYSRGSSGGSSSSFRRDSSMDESDDLLPHDDMDDDDNAAVIELEGVTASDGVVEKEDPLYLAIDDLEGRVVSALNDVKLHSGKKTPGTSGTVHTELATLLRPILELASHTGPSVARTYYRAATAGLTDEEEQDSVDEVYERLVSDLVLPVILEMAQSETIPAKRAAALEFVRVLYREFHSAGSWLDHSVPATSPQQGPYGSGKASKSSSSAVVPLAVAKRRLQRRTARTGEVLRYWMQAAVACLQPGVFTSESAAGAVASRGIIAASASLRPALGFVAARIREADDRGALRLFNPVMKMTAGVLHHLLQADSVGAGGGSLSPDYEPGREAIRAACIKFMEIISLCCSRRPSEDSRRRAGGTMVS
jgi:symplekin